MAKKAKKRTTTVDALPALERILGGPPTFGSMLRAIREGDELSLAAFAAKLGIQRAHLCDVEQGRKVVSADRAVKWARALGYSEVVFLRLALQGVVDDIGLKYAVELTAPTRAAAKRKAA